MAQDKISEKITAEQAAQISFSLSKWAELSAQPIDRDKAAALLKEICAIKPQPPSVIFAESFENLVSLVKGHLDKADMQLGSWSKSAADTHGYSAVFHSFLSKISLELRSRHRLKTGLLTYLQQLAHFESKIDAELYQLFYRQLSRRPYANNGCDSHVLYLFYTGAKYLSYSALSGEKFDGVNPEVYFDVLLNLPITFFVGSAIFACEKPQVSASYGRLHSAVKPAVAWNDGTGFYYLHGVEFEKDFWNAVVSGRMSFSEILKIKNKEQRHQAIWCNPNAFLSLAPQLIDQSEPGSELYLVESSELNEIYNAPKMWFLRFHEGGKFPPDSWIIEEIDPAFAEANPDAEVVRQYHCEFLEVYAMTYAEERQSWLQKT